ncbi:fumarylacetoacetate hydrolase family protein [Kineosporia sp. R_H_3]|uniref:fumarylacetoacetate hydrolase family protein n=1 Tax=Kineosporia sp. R_H_3 TaxID=1961848 RepID=UPI001E51CD81|nr:fumarylacetoacetate hydrolase family protein [Kineosporia sp. R_H_3]
MPDQIVRLATPSGVVVALAPDGDPGAARRLAAPSVADLLAGDGAAFRRAVGAPGEPVAGPVRLLPPVDGLTEVWASGVTYRRSSEARQEESAVADVYARVYEAQRPELFLKSVAWRAVGHGEPIGIRTDSGVDVPEPELALVCTASGEVVGLTVCDDVSSRTIEGENPLYLPQAKTYTGACALGPGIVPLWQVDDVRDLGIEVAVLRGGAVVWSGSTSTAAIHRSLDDLVEHLFRAQRFPAGVVLSTGTGIVPELDWTLLAGDVVRVSVAGVGVLENPVRDVAGDAFDWLTPDPARTPG